MASFLEAIRVMNLIYFTTKCEGLQEGKKRWDVKNSAVSVLFYNLLSFCMKLPSILKLHKVDLHPVHLQLWRGLREETLTIKTEEHLYPPESRGDERTALHGHRPLLFLAQQTLHSNPEVTPAPKRLDVIWARADDTILQIPVQQCPTCMLLIKGLSEYHQSD